MKVGDTYEVKQKVTKDITAAAAGSGKLEVFGTPFMIAMFENAAFELIQKELPEGKSSVGTAVNIVHTSPTPIGMEVTARAEVTNISENGKIIDFKVSAEDETGPIGEGTHQRAIITAERFLEKCNAKLSQGRP